MDDIAHAIEVLLDADADADRYGDLIHRLAEESCHGAPGREDSDAFVMVTTEMRAGGVVKKVVFDRHDAAQRFRDALPHVDPRLAPRG